MLKTINLTFVLALLFTSTIISTSASAPASHISPTYTIDSDTKVNTYEKRTLTQVQTDITNLSKSIVTLRDAANNFPSSGATLPQVLMFQEALSAVNRDLNTASRHIDDVGTLSQENSRSILNSLESLVPGVDSAMNAFIAKKAALQPFIVGTTIAHEDLRNLYRAAKNLYDSLFHAIPADQSPELSQLSESVLKIVQRALDAYS